VKRACIEPGCPNLTTATRCTPHQKAYKQRRYRASPHYQGDYDARAKVVRDTAERCWLCGEGPRADDPWTADHVYPGQPDSPLAPAHRSCNSRRGNRG